MPLPAPAPDGTDLRNREEGIRQAAPLPDHLLLFDGECNLCNGWVRFVIRQDRPGKFRFAPLQSAAGQALLAQHGLATPDLDTLVYFRKGTARTRSAAALHVARDLGGPWSLAYAFILVPRPLRDALYDLVARNRFRWFGRRANCVVPSPELRSRFLS